ncbi:DUF4407 domain-containing protein [Micromonospora sp. DT228]|uniref:DUF4407 domain-containing protein n=1 Tax=Micromonospora sp. DT228 TaxID=3393443 RepID=UPI003CE991FB
MTDEGMRAPHRQPGDVSGRSVRDPSRLLRALAGVDEALLRKVWHERARHTALGGVLVGTSLIAGFSMFIAINQAMGRTSALHLIPALLWSLFILNLDRLLVTSMAGNARRVGPLLMRLGVALMFGFIIAEPLVMRIFETAIEEHIKADRSKQIDTLRTRLMACNGEQSATAENTTITTECREYTLSFETTPASARRELAGTRAEVASLQAIINRDGAQLNRLRDNAAKECAGGRGTGFTGRPGDGPRCRQRTADADEFARTHPIAEQGQKLGELRARVAELERGLGGAVLTFEQARNGLVETRIEEERSHQGPIGFLERMDALHVLAGSSSALFVGTWAVRLFFVAIDCLPVVIKFFGGSSTYDNLYRIKSDSSQRVFADQVNTEERKVTDAYAAERDGIDNQARMRRAEHDLHLQEHQVELKARLGAAVSAYAADLLREPSSPSRKAPTRTAEEATAGTGSAGVNGRSLI